MSSDNFCSLTGNLTRDPELRFTTGGRAVCSFGLAVNRRWKNKAGDGWDEETSFFNIVAWGDMAENVATSLTKGSRVTCTGRLQQRSWETPENEKRSVVELVADEIGPSLRWATAQIERTERAKGTPGGGYDENAPVYGDEEPF